MWMRRVLPGHVGQGELVEFRGAHARVEEEQDDRPVAAAELVADITDRQEGLNVLLTRVAGSPSAPP